MSTFLPLLGLLALLIFPIVFMVVEGYRAKRDDERDILAHGRATTGTIVAVDEVAGPKGGKFWKVTVEFTVPDQPDPVRFYITSPESGLSKTAKQIAAFCQGQKVPVHYREKWPSLAVIDDLVH